MVTNLLLPAVAGQTHAFAVPMYNVYSYSPLPSEEAGELSKPVPFFGAKLTDGIS